jgi:hypothetical protein
MTADALEWPIMGLGMTGADFHVISPPELRDQIQDWGRRFSRADPRAEDEYLQTGKSADDDGAGGGKLTA